MTLPPLATDLVAPSPGRGARTAEICIVCMLVIVVSMTFQIPAPDTSAYVIFFAAKENSGLTILSCVIFVVVITVVVAVLFVLAPVALNEPTLRVGVIGAVSYLAFFLESASKIAAVTGVFGLVTAYALDLLQESFVGELATRGFLYAWLFVCTPMAVFVVYSLVFGRHPERLLRDRLAGRARLAARHLRREATDAELASAVGAGNAVLMAEVAMIKLLRRQPADTLGRLAAMVPLSYALLLTLQAWTGREEAAPGLPDRLDRLASNLQPLPESLRPGAAATVPSPAPDLAAQLAGLISTMESVVAGAPLPKSDAAPKHKSGFFVPDAFTNPLHNRFALKGALAALVCYVTFNLLDWPGIHTCLITCFVVALKTVGESLQKMILRLAGCLIGAALGLAAIVFVLPHTTSITDLTLVVGLVTLPAAWVAVGKPSVSYVGFQIAFAAYLCVLQGVEPKFDLTLARDRIVGVLFGNVVVYLIFTRVFPVSILATVREDLGRLLTRCRGLLGHLGDGRPAVATAGDVAEIQTMLGALEGKVAAFALEHRGTSRARLYAQSSRLGVKALRSVIGDLARLGIQPRPTDATRDGTTGTARIEAELGAALDAISQRLSTHDAPRGESRPDATPATVAAGGGLLEGQSDRLRLLRSCQKNVERLDAALKRFRRLASEKADAVA